MKQRGFTLLELVLTVAVVGIMATVAWPAGSKAMAVAKRRSTVRQFISAQSLTKATALAYRRVAKLHIDAANAKWWVEVDTSSTGAAKDTVGPVRQVRGKNISMTSNLSVLCFDARGLPSTEGVCEAGPLDVTFSIDGKSDSVRTTALGKVLR